MQKLCGIRVDIDCVGDIDALPAALDLLDDCGVKASFFVTMGPDRTGKRLFSYLKRPWDLGKAKPTRFGLWNLMRGIVSPARMEDCRDALRDIERRGHEVGLHGYDHYQWMMTCGEGAGPLIEEGYALFEDVFGNAPKSFASPGFTVNREILRKIDELGFDYSSDFMGKGPFYPTLKGEKFNTLQIPVNVRSIGEFDAQGLEDREIFQNFERGLDAEGSFTFYFHPSYEAKYRAGLLSEIIHFAHKNAEILTLAEIAGRWK
ncbi:MAG: polysaccharide deacetylase family protein [Candidatus Hydrothermarchaeaceae archaeon]